MNVDALLAHNHKNTNKLQLFDGFLYVSKLPGFYNVQ